MPTAHQAPRVERAPRAKDFKSADSAKKPAQNTDGSADFAQSLRDKRKDAEKADRSDAASVQDKSEKPSGETKPQAGVKKPAEHAKPEQKERAESDASVADSAAPGVDEDKKPIAQPSSPAKNEDAQKPLSSTPIVEVNIAPPQKQPSDAASPAKGDGGNAGEVGANESGGSSTQTDAASRGSEGARPTQVGGRAVEPAAIKELGAAKAATKQADASAGIRRNGAQPIARSQKVPPDTAEAKGRDAQATQIPLAADDEVPGVRAEAKAPIAPAVHPGETLAAVHAHASGKAQEREGAAPKSNVEADADGQSQAAEAPVAGVSIATASVVRAATPDGRPPSEPAGTGEALVATAAVIPIASNTNSSTGNGTGDDSDRPETRPDKAGPVAESTTPGVSVSSGREMDLLGRLVAEPVRAPDAQGATSQPVPGGASEFQRAMQAQVERGIERAAYQAAASGAWAGSEGGTGAVTLRLNPANLGMLRVHLRMDSASGGGVRARFEASSAKTRGILGDSIGSLRTALEDRGLRVDEVTVGEIARLPERDWGLPPVQGREDHSADFAQDSGAGFAGNGGQGAFNQNVLGSTGGAGSGSSAEIGGVHAGESAAVGPGEQSAMLSGSFGSPLRVGADGRIRVDALV